MASGTSNLSPIMNQHGRCVQYEGRLDVSGYDSTWSQRWLSEKKIGLTTNFWSSQVCLSVSLLVIYATSSYHYRQFLPSANIKEIALV